MSRKILLLLNCDLDKKDLLELRQHIESIFRLNTEDCPYRIDLSFAYNHIRRQYLGDKIIEKLQIEKSDPEEKWLLIVKDDLYSSDLNFIFGLADPSSGISLISIARLRPQFYGLPKDETLFLERLKKEAIHELGHLFLLSHCSNRRCVMRFSNSISDTDQKQAFFCERCMNKLNIN
ncbi:MAG: archaemetzincin family Zn-dependent metalloprotease [Thermodesulfovibrionales bacterium]|nr:archaemetzincin family Zn-dependent metalloprotease [Thermodesulfovibrionales bacterium]